MDHVEQTFCAKCACRPRQNVGSTRRHGVFWDSSYAAANNREQQKQQRQQTQQKQQMQQKQQKQQRQQKQQKQQTQQKQQKQQKQAAFEACVPFRAS